jgi:predicted  nucleic acid-binding Zn-ribbon protein
MASVWDKLDELRDEAKDLKEDIESLVVRLSEVVKGLNNIDLLDGEDIEEANDKIKGIKEEVEDIIIDFDDVTNRLY